MSRSSRRREAQRRSGPAPGAWEQADIMALIQVAIRYAGVSQRYVAPRVAELNVIGASAPSPHLDPAALVVDEVLSRIRAAWEHGWQPLDLVHATRRRTTAAGAKWIGRAVLVEADRTGALDRAPDAWADQLRELATRHDLGEGPDALLAPRGGASVASWTVALLALDFMHGLPQSQLLMPPPSRWDQTRSATTARRPQGTHDTKTLTKIRALLAKAESTEFSAEAEAFTAKAQDLMTRHAIDEALLADGSGQSIDVDGIRVLIHHPYGLEKASLLDVIAKANRTKLVWNDYASVATLVGVPTDLAQVEMLFTSTLVQATRAMTQAGENSHGGDRSSSFRKAFLIAYAVRIGQRLATSTDDATAEYGTATYGTALVPALQRQAEAVEGEYERLFPHVTRGSRRSTYDARGWDAGTKAADAAVLPAAEVGAGHAD